MTLKRLVIVLLLVLGPPAAYAYVRAGDFGHVAIVNGRLVTSATGDGCRIAWIEQDEAQARLVVLKHAGRQPSVLHRAPSLSGLALEGGGAFVAESERVSGRPSASLVRVDIASGEARAVGELPRAAAEIAAGDGYVCWREHWGSALPGVNFVAAGAPLDVIRAQPASGGEAATVTIIPGEPGESAEAAALIGARDGRVYWVEYGGAANEGETVLRQASLPGGRPETVAREPGRRNAALSGDALFWTAPSVEPGSVRDFCSVKRLLPGESRPEVIADWLEPKGQLRPLDGSVYVRERSRLWRLGEEKGDQRVVSSGLRSAVSSEFWSAVATHVTTDEEYEFVRTAGGLDLLSRPLTWRARLMRTIGR
ncbi:MAG: hypothetical protein MUQ65_03020 [Armatimonadetes bacterium]|nr:hypothetical protein [Armatimonadota bacterium]